MTPIDQLQEASYEEIKSAIDWIDEKLRGPAMTSSTLVLDMRKHDQSVAIENIMRFVFGMFPDRIQLSMVVLQDLLVFVLEMLFTKNGKKKNMGWWRKARIGMKVLSSLLKIIAALVKKKP